MGFLKRFGKHYAIERFAILFVVLFTSMLALVTSIVTAKMSHDKQVRVNQTMYTTMFTFSRTGTTGTVEEIYGNEDRTRVFVLLHLDDVSSMVLDANKYQMFVVL